MNLDVIWLFAVYLSLLVFIATGAFIALKLGIFSFKVVMNAVIALRNIENIEGPIRSTEYGISDKEKDIIILFIDRMKNFKNQK